MLEVEALAQRDLAGTGQDMAALRQGQRPRDRTAFAFDERGRLDSITDADGRRLDLGYDDSDPLDGRLDTVVDRSSGRRLSFSWTASGHVASVSTNPVTHADGTTAPLVWRYHYHDGRLVAACDPRDPGSDGLCTRYDHGAQAVTYTYDELGRRLSETVLDATATPPTEATTTFAHDAAGHLVSVTGPPVVDPLTGRARRVRL